MIISDRPSSGFALVDGLAAYHTISYGNWYRFTDAKGTELVNPPSCSEPTPTPSPTPSPSPGTCEVTTLIDTAGFTWTLINGLPARNGVVISDRPSSGFALVDGLAAYHTTSWGDWYRFTDARGTEYVTPPCS